MNSIRFAKAHAKNTGFIFVQYSNVLADLFNRDLNNILIFKQNTLRRITRKEWFFA